MIYKIVSLVDGSTKSCDLVNLSQSLSLNCEVLREVDGSHEAIGFVSHETLVFFAVEFADYALKHYAQKKLPEAEVCIALTRKWLENHDSVSVEELRVAAYAANAAAYAANAAAYAAAHVANAVAAAAAYAAANDAADAAASAANAADAAASAANAADAAANPAYTAAHVANAAAYAVHAAKKSKKKEQERQGNFILSYFNTSVI